MARTFVLSTSLASVFCLSMAAPVRADVTIRGRTTTVEQNLAAVNLLRGAVTPADIKASQALGDAFGKTPLGRIIGDLANEISKDVKESFEPRIEDFVMYLRSRPDRAIMRLDVGSQSVALADLPERGETVLVVFDHAARAFQTVIKLRGAARQGTGWYVGETGTATGGTRRLLGHAAAEYRFESLISVAGLGELGQMLALAPVDARPAVARRVTAWLARDMPGADEVRDFYRRIGDGVGGDTQTMLPGLVAEMASITRVGLPLEIVDRSATAILLWGATRLSDLPLPLAAVPLGADSTRTTVSAVSTDPIPDAVFSLDAPPGYKPMPGSPAGAGSGPTLLGLKESSAAGPELPPGAREWLFGLLDGLEAGRPSSAGPPPAPPEAVAGTPDTPAEPAREVEEANCDCSCAGFQAYNRTIRNPEGPLTVPELSAQAMCARRCASQWKGCRRQ